MNKKGHQKNFQKDKRKKSKKNKKFVIKRNIIIKKRSLNIGAETLKNQLIGKSNQFPSINFESSSSNDIKKTNSRKMKLYPLKNIRNILNDKHSQLKKFNESEIEAIFNIYDIDDNINFNYLLKLKKVNNKIYEELINHYKYSISYKNAINLGCLSINEINKEKTKYNKFMKLIKGKTIKDFDSFSKLKFFNFLLEIINGSDIRYAEKKEKFSIADKIKKNYNLKVDLLFKGPNLLGTFELQYYTLHNLYYHYLYEMDTQIHEKDNESLEMENEKPEKEFQKSDSPNLKKIFEQNTIIIDDFNFRNILNDLKHFFKEKARKIDIKYKNGNIKANFINDFVIKFYLISKYKEPIIEIINKNYDDNYIIKEMLFILYSLFFADKRDHDELVNCLVDVADSKKKEIFIMKTNYLKIGIIMKFVTKTVGILNKTLIILS